MAWLLNLSARLRLWLALAGAAVAAVLAAYLMGRRDQSTSDAGQRAQDTLDALDRGRRAVAEVQASGATPDERVRRNDGEWR
jgi:membrane protein implicated in regulation of membrane protease activity